MAKPRKLLRFSLSEISLVDRPAVQDAVVAAIRKRLDPGKDKPKVDKQDTVTTVIAHTSETLGHQHSVIRRQDGEYALGLGGDPSHTHDITVDGDRVQVAMGGDPSHTHDVKEPMSSLVNKSADKQAEIHALLELDNLKNWRKKKEDFIMNDIEKSRLAKAQAGTELDVLAKRCADELNLTPEGAMAKVLSTPRGEELYAALYARDVQKSAEDTAFDRACEKRIEELVTRATREWDSTEDVARKRRETMTAFYNGPEFAKLYDQQHAKAPVEKAEEPELEAVSLGLLSKVEIESDPQAALEKLATQVAWRDGVTKQAAMASFFDPESVGYELLLVADAATRVTGS